MAAQAAAKLFPKTVADIKAMAEGARDKALADLEALYKADGTTFETTCTVADNIYADFSNTKNAIEVVKYTNADKDVRDAATAASVEMENFVIEQFAGNRKLYGVLKTFLATNPELSATRQFWAAETMADFRRQGMELPEEEFKTVLDIQKQIAKLSTEFDTNIAEDKTTVLCEEADLAGVPPTVLGGLSKDDAGKFVLKMDYPTVFGVLKFCEVAETRKRVALAFDRRAFPANLPVLHNVVALRHKVAKMLGFPSYAHYDLDSKMAKDPKTAATFIDGLVPHLQKKWEIEKGILLPTLHKSVVLTDAGDMQFYDVMFSMERYKKDALSVDENKIQEYFPLDKTFKALFDIYEAFFDISFTKVDDDIFWAKEVSCLEVHCKKTKQLLGTVVMDLFPREGKFTHACCCGVELPRLQANGEYTPAVAAVLANFPKAQGDKPALFTHSDVETFFHEFGHGIHFLLGRTEMASKSGYNVKTDFVELPSQMLEEWLWEPSILNTVTSHYETGEPLPQALVDAKVRSKNAFTGRDYLRQLQFAKISLAIFDTDFASQDEKAMDSTQLMLDVQAKVMNGIAFNNDTKFQCNFGHLMGYAATYYGYMWSKVFAVDVFQYIADKNGLLSADLGSQYASRILGHGGGKDPNEMLREFLGRDPNNAAFLKRSGL